MGKNSKLFRFVLMITLVKSIKKITDYRRTHATTFVRALVLHGRELYLISLKATKERLSFARTDTLSMFILQKIAFSNFAPLN